MFDKITKKSHDYLQTQLDELKENCDKNPAVAELVNYIIAYSDEMAYSRNDASPDAVIGRDLCQIIWEISGTDLGTIGNQFHFNAAWAYELNMFIDNYFYDDAAFDFDIDERSGIIRFKAASDTGRWLQNPLILIEAAKANRIRYDNMDRSTLENRRSVPQVDVSRVIELVTKDILK
jgi:hypothetical protein